MASKKLAKHPGGRPPGVKMPCGWGCGRKLTAREMREHFTTCPKRPAALSDQHPSKAAGVDQPKGVRGAQEQAK